MSTRLREDDYSKDQTYEESTGKPKQIVINLPEEKPPVTLGSPSPSGGGAKSLDDGDIAVPVDDVVDAYNPTIGLRFANGYWWDDVSNERFTQEEYDMLKQLPSNMRDDKDAIIQALISGGVNASFSYLQGLTIGQLLKMGAEALGIQPSNRYMLSSFESTKPYINGKWNPNYVPQQDLKDDIIYNQVMSESGVPNGLNPTQIRSGYYGYGGLGRYGLVGSALGSLIAGMNWDIGRNIVDRFFGRTQEPLSKYQESLIINDAQSKGIDTSGKTIDQILAELARLPAAVQNESGLTDWQEYQREQDRFQNELALQRFDLEQARYYQQYERRPQYDPFMDEQAQQFNWLPDDAGFVTPSVDGGLDGYGQTKQVDVWDGFNEINYGERENMSYRRYTPRRSYRRRGGVSVGRIYVFSRTPRAGFYPKQTRYGMRYVKRRTY